MIKSGINSSVSGCSLAAIQRARAANIPASQLAAEGCGAKRLLEGGYQPSDLIKDGAYDQSQVQSAMNKLKKEGGKLPGNTSGGSTSGGSTSGGSTSGGSTGGGSVGGGSAGGGDAGGRGDANNNDNTGGNDNADSNISAVDKQRMENLIQQRAAMMSDMAGSLIQKWDNPPAANFVVNQASTKQAASAQTVAATGTVAPSTGASQMTGPTIKAGTVMYAVLTTSVNSDDNLTPVMAKIVSGPLKGSRLIGGFALAGTYSKKLMLKFNVLDLPGFPKSIPGLSAVAVDPNTSHAALSGSVNNHYWQRYGVMFASSFLAGIGQGLQSATTQYSVIDPSTGKVHKFGTPPDDK